MDDDQKTFWFMEGRVPTSVAKARAFQRGSGGGKRGDMSLAWMALDETDSMTGRDPEIDPEEVMSLLGERDVARLKRDFKTADRIQNHLLWTLNLNFLRFDTFLFAQS